MTGAHRGDFECPAASAQTGKQDERAFDLDAACAPVERRPQSVRHFVAKLAPSAGQDTERLRDELAAWLVAFYSALIEPPNNMGDGKRDAQRLLDGPLRQLIAERDQAREEGRREGERRVAGWALLLADEFDGLARTSDLIAAEFAKKGDTVTEQWHLGLAEARRTSASRLRAAVAPVEVEGA